jgi:hypothetical protein
MYVYRFFLNLPGRTLTCPQMLPEIGLGNGRNEEDYRADSRLSPNAPSTGSKPSRSAPAEYPNSPSSNKRRRLSSEEETESEQRDVVGSRFRGWSPSHHTQRPQSAAISPRSADRRISAFSSPESWATQSQPSRSSPYMTSAQNPSRHSPPYESSRPEWPARPTLPSLQTLTQTTAAPRARSSFNEYALDSSRANVQAYPQISAASFDPPVSYHPQVGFAYGYQQPRGQSYSGPSSYALAHDRTPFSASAHHGYTGGGYAYGVDASEGDNKQRKRRGNLPKETTDKLRAWFVAHLQHPYPTEDEKQELMRQTGLQMSEYSLANPPSPLPFSAPERKPRSDAKSVDFFVCSHEALSQSTCSSPMHLANILRPNIQLVY